MKSKNFISLSLALAFTTLAISGLLLYLVQHNQTTTAIHVVFGLLFLGFAVFHIINNWASLAGYTKSRKSGGIQKEFWISAAVIGIFLGGTWAKIPPFGEIEELGGKIRNSGGNKREHKIMFNEIVTNKDVHGTALRLVIQKGKDVKLPILAIWIEDSTHHFIENLFVPAQVSTVKKGEGDIDEAIREGEVDSEKFSADALPSFKTQAKNYASNYGKASPSENFILETNTSAKGTFYVYLEIKNNNTTERYVATLSTQKGQVAKLQSKDNLLIMSGLVEVK